MTFLKCGGIVFGAARHHVVNDGWSGFHFLHRTANTPLSSLPSNTNDNIITLNLPISTKLTQSNYLTWKAQMLPLLHGYNLFKNIDSPPSSTTIQTESGQISLNPGYVLWHHEDQLLHGWIRSSLTESISVQVVFCSSTAELWHTLQQTFSASSRALLAKLRRQLQTTTKGSSSCSDYLQTMHKISDELTFAGSPLSGDDLVMAVLNGLGPDYHSFIVAITTSARHGPLTFADLHGLLLSHEALLNSQHPGHSLPSLSNPSALFTCGPVNPRPPSIRNPRPKYTSNRPSIRQDHLKQPIM